MIKKLFILILFVTFLLNSNAQVPGFLGKKFSFYLSPSIGLPNHNGAFIFSPSYLYGANLEYIYNRRSSVGLKYNLFRKENYNPENWMNYPSFVEKGFINIHTFGPYVKFQLKNVLAPIGAFVKFGSDFQLLYIVNTMIRNENYDVLRESGNFIDFTFNISYGKNWIIANSILLGFEFESSIPFRSAFDYNIKYRNLTRQNLTTQLFKLKLNLGFLIF